MSTGTLAVHISITTRWPDERDPVTLAGMHPALRAVADANHGVIDRAAALAFVDHTTLDRAVASGQLVRPFPRTYLDPDRAHDRRTLMHAAISYAAGRAALSHLAALELWRLPAPCSGTLHLTTSEQHRLAGTPTTLCVHRRAGFQLAAPDVLVRDGLPVTRLEQAVVESWPLLDGDAQRAPAIHVIAQRMTTPRRLADTLARAPRLSGRHHLAHLIHLLEAGCRSELELWGYQHVFCGPAFAALRWQVPVSIDGRTIYLDALDPDSAVNLELDGTKYHGSLADRERDLRRDAAVQRLGYTVVRFSHYRLNHEVPAVRRDAVAIMTARRAFGA